MLDCQSVPRCKPRLVRDLPILESIESAIVGVGAIELKLLERVLEEVVIDNEHVFVDEPLPKLIDACDATFANLRCCRDIRPLGVSAACLAVDQAAHGPCCDLEHCFALLLVSNVRALLRSEVAENSKEQIAKLFQPQAI